VVVEPGTGLTRRGFLGVVFATSALVTLTTIGQTLRPLNPLALLAPRRPHVGPQDLPVNKSAVEAGVEDVAQDPDHRLTIVGRVKRPLRLSLEDLRGLDQHEVILPIACVEGWSATARWRGVRVKDLLALAGAPDHCEVAVRSLQETGRYAESTLNDPHAHDELTLLALDVNDETLHIDHGYPLRLIGPNRPGVMQTKWVRELEIL
jgi:DMSO/TMAO reductase YedYZ molybdopterin-dependent catalytic subunit